MSNVMVDGVAVDYSGLPEFCRETIQRYIEGGIAPGGAMTLILRGDIHAVCAADEQTFAALPQIVRWLHNHAPSGSWGSYGAIQPWMDARRAERRERAR